jgi:NADPH-dependent curcumin reductase CurA
MGPVKRKTNIMAQSTYSSVVLAQRPKANIVPGETFKLKQNPMISESDLKDGQVLVETLYLSLDPAMRGWLNGTSSNSSIPIHVTHTDNLQTHARTCPLCKSVNSCAAS